VGRYRVRPVVSDDDELEGKKYTCILDKPYRWEEWAAPKDPDGTIDHNKCTTGDDQGAAMTKRPEANGNDENRSSHSSHKAHQPSPPLANPLANPNRLLQPRGDYQTLLSFQKAEVVYDTTFRFAHKFLSRGGRTIDQMIQSARSGKQNILEGSKAATTSKEMEIKLSKTLEKEFVEKGRLRGRMTKARLNYRNQKPKE